jgi:MYXO-CTERM domain-containing protein
MMMLRTILGGAAVLTVLTSASLSFAAPCYVDSQAGNDSNDGLSEATPIQSQAAIPSDCTEVYYARGSVFNEAVDIGGGFGGGSRTLFTNYGDPSQPLPAFIVPHTAGSGPLVSAYQGGITIDGLYLAGSKGDGTMQGLGDGVCVTIGGGSHVLNSEITNCDIGMMLQGEGSLIQGNFFHDMTMAVDAPEGSVDPNSVGGGNGIFIHGSNNEIAYNAFVRCADTAEWTQSSCDGGATEITVGSGATVTGVKVHHNFSYASCGFLEIASMAGDTGRFENSEFYYNVHVDGGWLMLLQVNNTEMSNVTFTNNTVVQRSGSLNSGMVVTVFDGYSSGTEGGTLDPGEVSMTNNLIVFDGVTSFGDVIDPAIAQVNNLILNTSSQSPGLVNLAGSTAEDFDLVEGSPAIDAGEVTTYALDYLNRTVPDTSGVFDVGAFEYGSEVGAERPEVPEPAGLGGAAATGDPGPDGTGNTGNSAATTDSDSGGSDDDGGCSCTVPASPTDGTWHGLILFGLAGLLLGNRRRRAWLVH